MKQVINFILPEDIQTEEINKIRKKYDPGFDKIKPHLTLVYPFNSTNSDSVREHIKKVLKNFKSFEISFKGFEKSKQGNYLYLLVKKGRNKIFNLYKTLHTGVLKGCKNSDMPEYIPHITLGVFNTQEKLNRVINYLEDNFKKEFNFLVDRISLLTLDSDKITKKEEFKLK